MERKRIFSEKKIWLLVSILFVVNLLVFANAQTENSKVGNIWNYKQAKSIVEKMDEDSFAKTKNQQFLQIALYKQKGTDYRKEYGKKIEHIKEEAASLEEISIFQKSNSISNKNVKKTLRDFQKVEHITLEEGEDLGVESVTRYWYWTVALLIFGFVVATKLDLRDQTGLYRIVQSSYAGRTRLRLKQIGLLIGSIAAFGCLLWSSIICFSCVVYGFDVNWNRTLQSVPVFENVTLKCTVWQGLVLQGGIGILGALAGILTMYVLLMLVSRRQIIYFFTAFLYGVGYLFSKAFRIGNKGEILRLCNFYSFLKPGTIMTEYHNYNCFGILLGTLTMFLIVVAIIIIIGMTVSLILSKMWYWEHKREPFCLPVSVGKFPSSILGMEAKQILWDRKGIWFLLFSMLVIRFLSVQAPISYNEEQRALNHFYKEYSGALDERFYEHLDEMKNTYTQLQQESKQNQKNFEAGKIGAEEYQARVYSLNAEMEEYGIVQQLEEKTQKLEKIQSNGKTVSFVDERGYRHLLDKDGKRKWEAPIFIILVLILQIGIVVDMKNVSWRYSLRAAYKGRRSIFLKKGLLLFMVSFLFCLLLYGVDVYSIYEVYQMQQWSAPVASLEIGKNAWINVPIGLYFLFHYVCHALLYCVLGVAVYMVQYTRIIHKK